MENPFKDKQWRSGDRVKILDGLHKGKIGHVHGYVTNKEYQVRLEGSDLVVKIKGVSLIQCH